MAKKTLDSSQVLRAENYSGEFPIGEVALLLPTAEGTLDEVEEISKKYGSRSGMGILNVVNAAYGGPKSNSPIPAIYISRVTNLKTGGFEITALICPNLIKDHLKPYGLFVKKDYGYRFIE